MTRSIIIRIKDRAYHQYKVELNKKKSNKRKGRNKYYFRNHKRQGIGNIKPRKHCMTKTTIMQAMNTIVYSTSTDRKITKGHWDTESYSIAIDSCCSVSIAKNKQDFIGALQKCNVTIQGFNGTTKIKHKGIWKFKLEDRNGTTHDILIPNTLFAPEAPYHLLSPQHWGQQSKDPDGTYCVIKHNQMLLYWEGGKFSKSIDLDKESNCGFIRTIPSCQKYNKFAIALNSQVERSEDQWQDIERPETPRGVQTNEEIEPTTPFNFEENPHELEESPMANRADVLQREMWRWHLKLNHLSFPKIKYMALQGRVPKRLYAIEVPFCPTCAYGKATRKPWRHKNGQSRLKETKKPGQYVSVDTFESSTAGFVAQLKGTLTNKRYRMATVFIDHFSDLSFVHLQENNTSAELLKAKMAFEGFASSCGVKVMHYHADNGRFADNDFVNDTKTQRQSITYCGVNAHHQNGKAEKRIRDLQVQGRVMMIHAMHKWKDAAAPQLWPYAIRLANEVINLTPRSKDGEIPLSLFARSSDPPRLETLHPFGCPAYVLENTLQQGTKIGKWENRSRIGMYLGPSPTHARSVHLIMSIKTGLVSPQFHVKFDDFYETIKWENYMPKSEWQYKARLMREKPSSTPDLDKDNISRMLSRKPSNVLPISTIDQGGNNADDADSTTEQISPNDHSRLNSNHMPTNDEPNILVESGVQDHSDLIYQEVEESDIPNDTGENQSTHQRSNSEDEYRTRSGRRVTRTQKWLESREQSRAHRNRTAMNGIMENQRANLADDSSTEHLIMPAIIGDVMYLHQALQQPDKEEFVKAMVKEIETHEKRKHWKVVPMKEVPKNIKILDSIWAMRRKRKIGTGEISKYKARLNAHGGQQELGINYWETYAPVVMWTTIRLIITLATIQGWPSRQLDFVLAYPQAEVDVDIYMKLPKGFEIPNSQGKEKHCLKLLKNIYGLKQAGRVWNTHLHKGLIKLNYSQSKKDPCLYYRKDTILAIYIDDCILIAKTNKLIKDAIGEISEEFEITDEGKVDEYLGVKVEKLKGNRIKMSQPYLIDQILQGLGFNDRTKVKKTPAVASKILHRDEEGKEMQTEWEYRRVIGQLNFLEKSTRPDIAYAVHQCARFSSNPKESHKKAVLRIGRYLMDTRSQGIIFEPTNNALELWCDADFSGNWRAETAHLDRTTAKSRTGYIIRYAGCPLTWASKMQTETALSTTEAEFIALSEGLRTVIPIMELMEEMYEQGVSITKGQPEIRCKVFEDNAGALTIATLPKIRPRTKYINTKYWHFREHMEQGKVTIHPVSTKDQIADLLTKPLPESEFEKLKIRIMGEEHGDVCTNLKGSVEINEEKLVPGDEKRESKKLGFKTGANSASLNAKRLEGNNAERRTRRASNAIKG